MILPAFRSFAIRLQAIPLLVEDASYCSVADRISDFQQTLLHVLHALARPAQRRFRITPSDVIDQILDFLDQLWMLLPQLLASTTRASDPLRVVACCKIDKTIIDRLPAKTSDSRDGLDTAAPIRLCLGGGKDSPLLLIKKRKHSRQL